MELANWIWWAMAALALAGGALPICWALMKMPRVEINGIWFSEFDLMDIDRFIAGVSSSDSQDPDRVRFRDVDQFLKHEKTLLTVARLILHRRLLSQVVGLDPGNALVVGAQHGCRVLARMALRRLTIPTFYIQHALSVTGDPRIKATLNKVLHERAHRTSPVPQLDDLPKVRIPADATERAGDGPGRDR